MNMTEEKWSAMQQQQQVPQSPHHPHPTLQSQMNGVSSENFMPTYPYDGQSQLPVDQDNHQIYMQPKQEEDPALRQTQYPGYVSMSAPNTPTTTRPNGSPNTPQTPQSAPEQRKVGDNRPAFATGSFHSAPFPTGPIRKRRADALGFPVDAGPFFSQTKQHHNLYNMDRTNSYKLCINSKVDRGFFLADNDWTCYRRNYFQISSAFSITGTAHPVNESETPCLLEVDGQFLTVTQFLLGITARVSNSDKRIELVQHTPKRDKGPQMVPMPKPIRAGGNLNLSSVGSNANIVTFERIQFKTATANNGKRRAAQQYYVILVDLYAQVESSEHHRVATSTSAPLVVRGRSPGHYADNHDRFSHLAINPAFANDRHMTFQHPHGPNGGPSVMPGDFGGAPFSPYGQYPPAFPGYPPVNNQNPMSLMMPTSAQNTSTPPFHTQPSHQPYMVPSISEVSPAAESANPEIYNNPNIDPNNLVNGGPHDQKIQQMPQHHHQQQVGLDMHNMEAGAASSSHSAFSSFDTRQGGTGNGNSSKPFMKIEIPQSSELPDHPMTSPAYHNQDYVDGFQMYHNGHPATNASAHHGGYHSDDEQHHANELQPTNGRSTQQPHTESRTQSVANQQHGQKSSPQLNGGGKIGPSNNNTSDHHTTKVSKNKNSKKASNNTTADHRIG